MTPTAATQDRTFWMTGFWICASMLCLIGILETAPELYKTSWGHYPAELVAVMRSREILDNPGTNGYYERLLAKSGRMDKNYLYDHSFRVFRFRPNLTWKENMVVTNSFGLIGPEVTLAKPPNTRRVALVGGSLSSGHMVFPEETYATLLENKLNAAAGNGEKIQILNFACIAYTLPQMLDTAIEDAPKFSPDVYLIDLNELDTFRQWDRQLVEVVQDRIDPKYDFIRSILQQAHVSPDDTSLTLYGKLAPYRVQVIRWSLEQLKANAERHHAAILGVMVPGVEAGRLSARRTEWVREITDGLEIPVVDITDSFDSYLHPSALAAYPGDPHPNAKGHAMMADDFYDKLRGEPKAWAAMMGKPLGKEAQ